MTKSWREKSWNTACIQFFLIENYQELQRVGSNKELIKAFCSSNCKGMGDMYVRYDVERSFWSREAILILLYFISSYFISPSLLYLGHRDIHSCSLNRLLKSGWHKRVSIVYKLQFFLCCWNTFKKNVLCCFVSQYGHKLNLMVCLILSI